MGYMCTSENKGISINFRIVILTGRHSLEGRGPKSFNQILLLSNDLETLLFVEKHLDIVVNNTAMVKTRECAIRGAGHDDVREFCRNIEPLIDALTAKPEKDLLSRMTTSLKKALLSIAIERSNSDRTSICNALGISDRQLEEELRLCGLNISDKSNKQKR